VLKRTSRLTMLCVALCALLAVGAASASAATLYVSNTSPTVPNGKSCVQPDFSQIQAAVTAATPGSKITVCPGTYPENVQIEKGLKIAASGNAGSATVGALEGAPQSSTPCDTNQTDAISICTSETVTVTGIAVTAKTSDQSCAGGELTGIAATGGGTFKATNVTIDGAAQVPLSGCQRGFALEIGSGGGTKGEQATLTKVAISGYQKGGIFAEGDGTTSLKINSSSITGAGPTPATAQNGIQVDKGVLYKIKSSTISGNECEAPSCGLTATQAAGILSFGAAPKSGVTSSTIKENDFGAYYLSEAASQPATAEVTFTKDAFTNNRDEGILLDQGKAALKTDTISGGVVGVELYQYEGQTLASESTATSTKAEGSEASIKVNSDKAATDIPGVFTFSSGTLTGPIINENPTKFKVIL
jgi:nitrous oxidase accessory protein NosD